jgi:cyclase
MFRPRVIPCLLLLDGGLVKTTQFQDPIYIGDPMNAVKIFNDAEADELIFLDIAASKTGKKLSPAIVRRIADEAFMPFGVGGGLNSLDDIKSMFDSGAEKVILNSILIKNPDLISEAAAIFGSQAIVAAIDAKASSNEYEVFTHGGSQLASGSLISLLKRYEDAGAGEIFINAIHRDGSREGFDPELIELVAANTQLPVVACGGAGSYDDFKLATHAGASAIAAGSVFVFVGRKKAVLINYPERDEMFELFND